MKASSNLTIAFLALVSVVATGVAWQQYWKAARLQAAAGSDDSADLRRRLAAAERHARELDDLLAARSGAGAVTDRNADAVAADGAASREADQNRSRSGTRNGLSAIFDRPEMQRLRTLQQKAALDSRYGALFKSLNLSAESLGKFKSLLAEKESTMMDTMMAAREQGVDPRTDPQGFRKLVASTQATVDNEIKTVLGSEGFTQYEQYQQTQPQRTVVSQLQQSLSYTSEPLSETQAAQMVQILAATTTAPADGGGPAGGPPGPPGGFGGGGGALITAATVAQAQTILSPTQQQALLQLQQVQAAQQQVQQLMRDNGMGGPPGNGAAGGG